MDNEQNILCAYADICAYEKNISLNAYNKLSRLCKYTFELVQWRLIKYRDLRDKLAPMFGEALHKRIIGHPFEYTSKCMKIMHIPDMRRNRYGLRFLDTGVPLFSNEYLAENRIAFTDVSFITTAKIPFMMTMFVLAGTGCDPIFSIDVLPADYIDSGHPDRFIIHMRCPTRRNPITIGHPFAGPKQLQLCISSGVSMFGDVGILTVDHGLVDKTFTHAIVRFKTVSQRAYDWDKFAMMIDEEVPNPATVMSLIREMPDDDDHDARAQYFEYARRRMMRPAGAARGD